MEPDMILVIDQSVIEHPVHLVNPQSCKKKGGNVIDGRHSFHQFESRNFKAHLVKTRLFSTDSFRIKQQPRMTRAKSLKLKM